MRDAVRSVGARRLTALLVAAALLLSALPALAEEMATVPLWQPLGETVSPPNPRDYLIPTPQSPDFSRYGYVLEYGLLFLELRDSGALYVFYDVDFKTWDAFSRAASLGDCFRERIKGAFDCSRVW